MFIFCCVVLRYIFIQRGIENEYSSTAKTGMPAFLWRGKRYFSFISCGRSFIIIFVVQSGFVDMCVKHIPSPQEAAQTKVSC